MRADETRKCNVRTPERRGGGVRYRDLGQNQTNRTLEVSQEDNTKKSKMNQVSHSGRGKRSSFVRHLIWLRKTIKARSHHLQV